MRSCSFSRRIVRIGIWTRPGMQHFRMQGTACSWPFCTSGSCKASRVVVPAQQIRSATEIACARHGSTLWACGGWRGCLHFMTCSSTHWTNRLTRTRACLHLALPAGWHCRCCTASHLHARLPSMPHANDLAMACNGRGTLHNQQLAPLHIPPWPAHRCRPPSTCRLWNCTSRSKPALSSSMAPSSFSLRESASCCWVRRTFLDGPSSGRPVAAKAFSAARPKGERVVAGSCSEARTTPYSVHTACPVLGLTQSASLGRRLIHWRCSWMTWLGPSPAWSRRGWAHIIRENLRAGSLPLETG